MIAEAQTLLETTTLPQGRADTLLETSPAATLGAKGGKKTAERGPDYFRKIAATQKTRAGGRPKNSS